eukprot:CAMPEP_0115044440 /NCGR_PEP_ID=MMETSP0216-20121206/47484_1 /TAXON_ID=223996 /ORGANISM="Protocruzia adherens, Strain Boccale" /LENGTH=527 /DNA_ID=CAMNT_0002426989 /DNA_START=25 /DNA_END=1608 /DNA_ORIENTATION=-
MTEQQTLYTEEELAAHNTPENAWLAIDGNIYDITKFAAMHPGGKKLILEYAGKDASEDFNYFHSKLVLHKYHSKLFIGRVKGAPLVEEEAVPETGFPSPTTQKYGVPYGSPTWDQGWKSPYFNDSHTKFRAAARKFYETEVSPYAGQWSEAGHIPLEVTKKMADVGLLQGAIKGVWNTKYFGNKLPGGIKPEEYDWHHWVIGINEVCKAGSLGFIWGVFTGVNIGLPPVLNFASDELKDRVVADVAHARKYIALAVTEPWVGSDVGNIKTTAKLSPDGKHYIVNGAKKWITNGMWADYFTTAVRTGGDGMGGVSLLLLEKDMPGFTRRPIKVQGTWGSGTSYLTFENVKVPVENLIGKPNKGFKYIMANFNTERFGIIIEAIGCARVCYDEAYKYASKRKTFGKKLIEHPVIRNKLAHMIRQIEPAQAWIESAAYQMNNMSPMEQAVLMAGPFALAKANATLVMEFCAREALQIFGGLGYTRGGQGEKVERLYREVKALSIPGGSEEIMLDLGMRQAQRMYPKTAKL